MWKREKQQADNFQPEDCEENRIYNMSGKFREAKQLGRERCLHLLKYEYEVNIEVSVLQRSRGIMTFDEVIFKAICLPKVCLRSNPLDIQRVQTAWGV